MSGQTHGGKGDRPRIIEDRVQYENNWHRIFGSKKEAVVSYDPVASSDVERKLKEWDMMYECLKSMHLYEYPVEEAKEVLKRIEDEK